MTWGRRPTPSTARTRRPRRRRRRRRGSSPKGRPCSASTCSTCCRIRRRHRPATVRFLLPSGTTSPGPTPRAGQPHDDLREPGGGLDETDVSGDISADAPIVVERAMYRSVPGQPFALGTTRWACRRRRRRGSWPRAPLALLRSLRADRQSRQHGRERDRAVRQAGRHRRDPDYTVRAHSRFSVYVDGIPGLENTAVATTLTSTTRAHRRRARHVLAGRVLRLLRGPQFGWQHDDGARMGRHRRREGGADRSGPSC